ncbi:MAG: DnaT-like ssDNA-binding protein [Planctomycetota bacterium]|jgi:hypothetical protein
MADISVETGTGSTTANSYCNVDNADDYHESHLYAASWTSASEIDKEKGLMMATRLLDNQVVWNGYRTSNTQALMWPRTLVYDREGYTFESDTIPAWLIEATAEYARHLITEDLTSETNRDLVGFKEVKVGDLQLKVDPYRKKSTIPSSVWSMIRFYCKKVGAQKRLVRV